MGQISDIIKRGETALDIVMVKLNITVFSKSQLRFLKEYTDILKVIADSINTIIYKVHAVLLPTLFFTKEKLNEIDASNTFISSKPLLSAVMCGFNKRFHEIMDFDNKKFISALIATVSHSFFKLRWLNTEFRTLEQV